MQMPNCGVSMRNGGQAPRPTDKEQETSSKKGARPQPEKKEPPKVILGEPPSVLCTLRCISFSAAVNNNRFGWRIIFVFAQGMMAKGPFPPGLP